MLSRKRRRTTDDATPRYRRGELFGEILETPSIIMRFSSTGTEPFVLLILPYSGWEKSHRSSLVWHSGPSAIWCAVPAFGGGGLLPALKPGRRVHAGAASCSHAGCVSGGTGGEVGRRPGAGRSVCAHSSGIVAAAPFGSPLKLFPPLPTCSHSDSQHFYCSHCNEFSPHIRAIHPHKEHSFILFASAIQYTHTLWLPNRERSLLR